MRNIFSIFNGVFAVMTVVADPFWLQWFTIQRPRSSSASSARNTQTARLHKHHVVKNVTAPSVAVVMIVSNKVSRVVLSQFLDVQRRHQRRFHSDSHAKHARRLHAIALADLESLNGLLKRRRSTPNQHGKRSYHLLL